METGIVLSTTETAVQMMPELKGAYIDFDEASVGDIFKKMQPARIKENEDLKTFEQKGELWQVAFLGLKRIEMPSLRDPNTKELVLVAVFLSTNAAGNPQKYLCAQTKIVNFFKSVQPQSFWFIEYLGKAKGSKYSYDDFNVYPPKMIEA